MMYRTLKYLCVFSVLSGMLFAAVHYWTFRVAYPAMDELEPAQTIVCLAAGLRGDGSMGPYTAQRARACIDLYEQGLAPKIAFSGGNSDPGLPATAEQMAAYAELLGVSRDAMIIENRSESTLQNALFTIPKLSSRKDFILVTDSFHLPRSAASFFWFGGRKMQLYPANTGIDAVLPDTEILIWEVAKIWLNAIRAPLYTLSAIIGVPRHVREYILV